MQTIDAGNMEWNKIPQGYLVRGNKKDGRTVSWSAVKDGKAYLLNWGSQDAYRAQRHLQAREIQDERSF